MNAFDDSCPHGCCKDSCTQQQQANFLLKKTHTEPSNDHIHLLIRQLQRTEASTVVTSFTHLSFPSSKGNIDGYVNKFKAETKAINGDN